MSDSYEQILFETRDSWRSWLASNHATSPGVWLVTWKVGAGRPVLTAEEAIEEALCFGWVDSRPRSVDSERTSRLVTPRRPRSSWSRVNKQRVERLTALGLMHRSGLAAVETAKANGAWTALDEVETLVEPPDLAAALASNAEAARHWADFPRSTRRAILEWISSARTDSTRSARVRTTVDEAAVGVRANQWRQPKGSGRAAPQG